MTEKKQAAVKQTAIHTVQVGDVVAEIRLRKSNSGYSYLDFSLERTYTTSTGRQSRGATFFAANERDLLQVVQDASAWIRAEANTAAINDNLTKSPGDDHQSNAGKG